MMSRGTSLFRFEQGSHICALYRDDIELIDILTPYVADGLRNGDRCVCVQKPRIAKQLYYQLQFLGVDTEREARRGSLEIYLASDFYRPKGKFEAKTMMEIVERATEDSVKKGFRALRGAGDLSWAAEPPFECDQVADYETQLQMSCPGKPAILLCQYQVPQFSPQVLDSMAQAHQFVMVEMAPDSNYTNLCIHHGQHEIDITARKDRPHSQFDFVVRRSFGCVVGWGSETAFEAAKGRARTLLAESWHDDQAAPH
jgi:hypothetical protein